MKIYIIEYGYGNKIKSTSRNARQHLTDLGGERIRITTQSGKFVCQAWRTEDGILVSTLDPNNEN